MKKILAFLLITASIYSCTKQDVIETGLANGVVDGTIMEYMQSDSYNYDSTLVMINHTGLNYIFDGTDDRYKDITFLAPTNLSILKFMLGGWYPVKNIEDLDVEECKQYLLKYVINEKLLRDDIPKGREDTKEGGKLYETIQGDSLWLYTYQDPWNGIPDQGPKHIFVESQDHIYKADIASSNIQCDNGVVHSLHYTHIFGDL